MNRRTLVPMLAALGLFAGAGGCGRDSHGSVALARLCFPPTPDANGICAYPPTCTEFLAEGALEVDQGGTLEFPIEIQNERADNSDLANNRTNTNFAIIERFDLKYQGSGFTVPSGFVNQTFLVPVASSAVALVALIPRALTAASSIPVDTSFVIKVSAHGRYGDDTQFDTPEFTVPVTVRRALPFTCSDPTKKPAACPQLGQTAVVVCI